MARVKHAYELLGDKANKGTTLLRKLKALRAMVNNHAGRIEFLEKLMEVPDAEGIEIVQSANREETQEAEVVKTKIKKNKT